MTFVTAIDFAMAALNLGLMVQGIMEGCHSWWVNLSAAVFCFCMGIICMDKVG